MPDADLWICDSTTPPPSSKLTYIQTKEEVIETVITYLRLATGNEKFSCVKLQVKVAKSSLADSGIATAVNTLSVIHGEAFQKEMGEVRCWEVRERFLRDVLESTKLETEAINTKGGVGGLGGSSGHQKSTADNTEKEEDLAPAATPVAVCIPPHLGKHARLEKGVSPARGRSSGIQKKTNPKPPKATGIDCRWLDNDPVELARASLPSQPTCEMESKPDKRSRVKTKPSSRTNRVCTKSDDDDFEVEKQNPPKKKARSKPTPGSTLDCRWLDQEEPQNTKATKGSKKSRSTL